MSRESHLPETLAEITGAAATKDIRVTITGPTSIMRSRVIPETSKLLKKYPRLLFTYHVNDFGNWIEELRSGSAQLAVVPATLVPLEMESRLLQAEKFVLVGPKSWKSRTLSEIVRTERIIDFDRADAMTMNYLKKFKLEALVKNERHFVNNTESLIELIENGHGYGVLALEFVEKFLRNGKLTLLNGGRTYDHRMALTWYARTNSPGYFTDILKAAIK